MGAAEAAAASLSARESSVRPSPLAPFIFALPSKKQPPPVIMRSVVGAHGTAVGGKARSKGG